MIARRTVAAFHPRATGFCFTKGSERLDRNARVFAIDLICRVSHRESRSIAVRAGPVSQSKMKACNSDYFDWSGLGIDRACEKAPEISNMQATVAIQMRIGMTHPLASISRI
jgi:hypothetical protein